MHEKAGIGDLDPPIVRQFKRQVPPELRVHSLLGRHIAGEADIIYGPDRGRVRIENRNVHSRSEVADIGNSSPIQSDTFRKNEGVVNIAAAELVIRDDMPPFGRPVHVRILYPGDMPDFGWQSRELVARTVDLHHDVRLEALDERLHLSAAEPLQNGDRLDAQFLESLAKSADGPDVVGVQ